jgi:hypothetical protein
MSEENNIGQSQVLPPVKIAFIIDNVIVDVIHTDERLAAIFLSNPVIKDITAENGEQIAFTGWVYNPETDTYKLDTNAEEGPFISVENE